MPSGIFHDFHQAWTITIRAALNNGILPKGYAALAEQHAGGLIPDVLTLQSHSRADDNDEGGVVARTEPETRFVRQTGAQTDAQNGNRIVIRHALRRVVAMIEVVSPGNKESRSALNSFVQKTVEFLQKGVHVLIVDLFPPARRDPNPNGIHKVIWDEFLEEEFELPEDERVTLVSYRSG